MRNQSPTEKNMAKASITMEMPDATNFDLQCQGTKVMQPVNMQCPAELAHGIRSVV